MYRNAVKTFVVSVARSIEGLEKLRPAWERMQWHPNADIDFYRTIIDARKEVLNPYVISLSLDGIPKAMLIGRIEEKRLDFKVGYKTVFRPRVRLLTVVYGGLLGEQTREVAEALISEIDGALRKGEFDLAFLSNLKTDSHLYRLSRTRPGFLCREKVSNSNVHWKTSIPGTIDDFLARIKSKHRYWLRRISKNLEKDYPGRVRFDIFSDRATVGRFCADIEEVAKKTYLRGMGSGFIMNDENMRRFSLAADKGWLGAYILYIDERPCAFWTGTLYKGAFFLDFTGYEPALKKYELGTILFVRMIEDLCSKGVSELDFGFGEALYKQHFGENNWSEGSVYVFAPSIKSAGINAAHMLTNGSRKLVESVLIRLKFLQQIKRRWRERLIQKEV